MKKTVLCAGVVALALSGCAKPPSQIAANYVDPRYYRDRTCDELESEAVVLSNQAYAAVGQQQETADRDAALTGVGIIVAWPALLFLSRDSAGEATIANLRGRMNAIEQVAAEKNCTFVIQKI